MSLEYGVLHRLYNTCKNRLGEIRWASVYMLCFPCNYERAPQFSRHVDCSRGPAECHRRCRCTRYVMASLFENQINVL